MLRQILNRSVIIGAIVWLLVMMPIGLVFFLIAFATMGVSEAIDRGAVNRIFILIGLVAFFLTVLISAIAARFGAKRALIT